MPHLLLHPQPFVHRRFPRQALDLPILLPPQPIPSSLFLNHLRRQSPRWALPSIHYWVPRSSNLPFHSFASPFHGRRQYTIVFFQIKKMEITKAFISAGKCHLTAIMCWAKAIDDQDFWGWGCIISFFIIILDFKFLYYYMNCKTDSGQLIVNMSVLLLILWMCPLPSVVSFNQLFVKLAKMKH